MLENGEKYTKAFLIFLVSAGVGTALTSMIAGEKWAIYQSSLIGAWMIGNLVWLIVSGHTTKISNKMLGMVAVTNALLIVYVVAFKPLTPPAFMRGDYIGTPWGMAPEWTFLIGSWHVAFGAIMPQFMVNFYHSIEEVVAEFKKKRATAVLAEQATAVTTEQATAEQ